MHPRCPRLSSHVIFDLNPYTSNVREPAPHPAAHLCPGDISNRWRSLITSRWNLPMPSLGLPRHIFSVCPKSVPWGCVNSDYVSPKTSLEHADHREACHLPRDGHRKAPTSRAGILEMVEIQMGFFSRRISQSPGQRQFTAQKPIQRSQSQGGVPVPSWMCLLGACDLPDAQTLCLPPTPAAPAGALRCPAMATCPVARVLRSRLLLSGHMQQGPTPSPSPDLSSPRGPH